MNVSHRRRHHIHSSPPRGLVLLVVLGMLTLFSVLAVSYLVFTTRQRSAAISISRADNAAFDGEQLLGDALEEALVGSTGPESSLWGHDLLGDLYGMRDAVLGEMTPFVVNDDPVVAPNVLLNDFVRIPTELFRAATYPNRRDDHPNLSQRRYPANATPTFERDEELSGRILTFREGPLQGLSFKILRSFGNHVSTAITNNRQVLSGQLVLDLRPHLGRAITIESLGETNTLARWVEKALLPIADPDHDFISRLFYDFPPEAGTGARPLSNFYVNGGILNGPGSGFDVGRQAIGLINDPNYNLNEVISTNLNVIVASPPAPTIVGGTAFEGSPTGTDVPAALQGHHAVYRREAQAPILPSIGYLQDLPAGDVDEPYDAPDEQNLWLSYFPTNEVLGASSPSFVRPALLHWLINQQSGQLDTMSQLRLRQILRAIQRSTLRPLPIRNDINTIPVSVAARNAGVLQLDYSDFTGSNQTDLGRPSATNGYIDFNGSAAELATSIRNLVRSLAGADSNGDGYPDWDVDNNGDGIPDSIWVDAGLPMTEAADGTLVKPLVAYLIEDLGGRVDVNLAGNLAQARGVIQKRASGVLYRTGGVTPPTPLTTINDLPAGLGFGPAEINLRPLFGTSMTGNGPLDLLRRRLTTRTFGGIEYVAAGNLVDPITRSGNDLPGVLRQPLLPNLHSTANRYGLPVDKFGRSSLALGIDGGLMVANASVAVQNAGNSAGDSIDDPYELVALPGEMPDHLFSLPDMEAMLRFNDFDRDALDSALTELANQNIATPAHRQEFADSVSTISSSAAVNTGMLPQEYRATLDANTAVGPAAVFDDAMRSLPPNAGVGNQFPVHERNALLMQLLPPEVLAGGKLNLNRPFGNGVDDDGDGVIDDPQELRTAAEMFYRNIVGTPPDTFYRTEFSDLTPGEPGPASAGGAYPEPTPQAWFARHLYVMAMTLVRNLNNATAFDFTNGVAVVIDPSNTTVRRVDLPTPEAFTVVNTPQDEYRAWVLAQWAINVADFRDPDAIMSRFDYDVYPFDGWQILGPGTNPPNATPTFRTVWGMEYPELALEESLAFHDRRARDTNLDAAMENRFSGGMVADIDLDQWRIPQGSLFLELRSTRSPDFLRVPADDADDVSQAWGVPTELYSQVDVGGGTLEYMLDLARTAPDLNPVWRIAITPPHLSPLGNPTQSADEMLQPEGSDQTLLVPPFAIPAADVVVNRMTATLQPDRPSFFGPAIPVNDRVNRVIWFSNINPDPDADGVPNMPLPADSNAVEKIFYNRFGFSDYSYQIGIASTPLEVHLRGGQYAVIGPRQFTPVGSLQTHGVRGPTHNSTTNEPLVAYAEYESPQRFSLNSNGFEHRLFTGVRSSPTVATGGANATIRDSVGIIAAANVPAGFTGAPVIGTTPGIGINVSEPLPDHAGAIYYPSPTFRLKPDFPLDSYHNFDGPSGTLPDRPFDETNSMLFNAGGTPDLQTGTRERFATAYLQRLADPTQPFNEIANPYLSVDYITIDLTVFNGSEDNENPAVSSEPEWTDPLDPDPFGTAPDEHFATRYKTGRTIFEDTSTAWTENLSHSVNTFPPEPSSPSADLGGHVPYFDHELHLEDLVNPSAMPPGNVDTMPTPATRITHSSTLGYANFSYGPRWRTTGTTDQRYAGMPVNNYFSSATWLNRSYVSPAELMWVPTTSAGRFGAAFGTATTDTGFTAGNVFTSTAPPHLVGDRTDTNQVFPHLWNYYSSDAASFVNSPNLHRILNFVDVPAPYDFENDFVSTNRDIVLFPSVTAPVQSTFGGNLNYATLGGATATGNPNSWTNAGATTNAFWLNQFTVEAFRTPMNILQPQYRSGRINLNTIKSPAVFQALMEGVADSTDPTFTTFLPQFINSRRGYVPAVSGDEPLTQVGATGQLFERTKPTQFSGAFRPSNSSDLAPLPGDRVRPLDRTVMRPAGVTGSFGTAPLFQQALSGSPVGEMRERSVLHQQLATTRLNNLASEQSNAFGVWITVGLFKVDGNFHVNQELGADLGQTQRFQSFHIIDRSIPAMYEPGQLNNALETVLLSRRLK